MYIVKNPSTGVVEKEYPRETNAEIDEKLERGHQCYRRWTVADRSRRADALRRVADLYHSEIENLASILVREVGKPIGQAREEVALAASIYRYYADQGPEFVADTALTPSAGGTAVIRTDPVGVILGIMPWNFPYYQTARFSAPNIVIGNNALLKPAPQCPESAAAMNQIFRTAGLDDGEFDVVLADNEQVAGLIGDYRVAGVSLTGSERAGAAVAESAGRNIKKVLLELGGSDPFIVLDTDDLSGTVKAAVGSRTYNTGQMCNAAKRIIVIDKLYDNFVEQFSGEMKALRVGDPFDDATDLGPMSSESALDTLLAQIQDAIDKGATLRAGGSRIDRPGSYIEPTVLTDVNDRMRAYHEELFGPAAVIYRVADADEAVEVANSSPYGLGGAVYSADLNLAQQVADRLSTGMVWINSPQGTLADLPFGGTKRSGFGRELGELGIAEFVNKKLIYAPPK